MAQIPRTVFSDLESSLLLVQTQSDDVRHRALAGTHLNAANTIRSITASGKQVDTAVVNVMVAHTARAVNFANARNWKGVLYETHAVLTAMPGEAGWSPDTLPPVPD